MGDEKKSGAAPQPMPTGTPARLGFVTLSLTTDSPLCTLLIHYARSAHLELESWAREHRRTRQEPLLALVLTATAAEAAVNFALEPMLSPTDWNAIERKGQERKWKRLSRELGLAPALHERAEPLASFLKVLKGRHQVVHLQRGKSVMRLESPPIPLALVPGRRTVHSIPVSAMNLSGPETVEDLLSRRNASTYYPAFEALLRHVLPALHLADARTALLFEHALDGRVTEATPS